MKKEIKTYTTVCDICEQELHNHGRFEEPYFNKNNFDLCYICAGKLFAAQIGNKISEEKLQGMIEKAKILLNSESPFGTLDVNEMIQETPVESQQEDLKGMFKVHKSSEMKVQTPSLDSIDCIKNLKDL